MTADNAPRLLAIARPHPRIPKPALHGGTRNLHDQLRTQRGDRHIVADSANPKLLRCMAPESNLTGRMCGEILRLGPQLPIGTGEQQVVGKEARQRGDIRIELGQAQLTFHANDLGVSLADQNAGQSIIHMRTNRASGSMCAVTARKNAAAERQLLLRADRPMLRATLVVCLLGNSKHSLARPTQMVRRNSLSRNGTVTVSSRVGRTLGAPRSRSVHARRGAYKP